MAARRSGASCRLRTRQRWCDREPAPQVRDRASQRSLTWQSSQNKSLMHLRRIMRPRASSTGTTRDARRGANRIGPSRGAFESGPGLFFAMKAAEVRVWT